MRTEKDINENLRLLDQLKVGLKKQMDIIENDYQKTAVECTGMRCEAFDHIKTHLHDAWNALNTLWHMELDAADE